MHFAEFTMRRALSTLLIETIAMLVALTGIRLGAVESRPAVVFFGDSLTAGFGVDPDNAYPSLLAERVRLAGLDVDVVNAGVSGDTTAAGARRVAWVLRRSVAVFVLALGGNDGLRGVPPAETERNLQSIVDTVRRVQPTARIILAGMQAPPNMGPEFTQEFREIFPRVAERNGLVLMPFLLEGVGGVPEFNQADGIHPNPEGHRHIAEILWPVLEPVIRDALAPRDP